jgi:transketolase
MGVQERDLRPDVVVHTHAGAPRRHVVGDLDQLVVNTIRTLAIDAVEAAGSGHPGTPMALAPVAYVLWSRFLKHDPSDPGWPDRDRFVLSAGHASMLLYAMVHLSGYDLALEELERFRQWGSRCPGHPERGVTPGVEVTTGPLGQGFANAVGLAIAERMLAARFNRPGNDVVDHHTYVICSDGDLMEGVSAGAASLAGNLRLGNLVALYDDAGRARHAEWENRFARYQTHYPELAADLAPSTDTYLEGFADVSCREFSGRNFHFGVREHAMGAVMNGLAAHGGLRPFGGTFFVFSDYMRPAIRMAALMRLPVVLVLTHDSIGLGEDGPTHQPVEHLAALRAIPNLLVIRPADANETAQAWGVALARPEGPAALVLSRQKLPVLAKPPQDAVARGAHVIADGTDIVLVATGSEVHLALSARELLAAWGISARVVSMPCWELFASQPAGYRQRVLPPGLPRLGVEAAGPFGWCAWVDDVVSLDRFGASAPAQVLPMWCMSPSRPGPGSSSGIEYGLMVAYAEGLAILHRAGVGAKPRAVDAETAPLADPRFYRYDIDTAEAAELWRRGSVVGSWLLDLTAAALLEDPGWRVQRPGGGLGRGTLDGDGSCGGGRSRPRAQRRHVRAVQLTGCGRFRRPCPVSHAQAVRRALGAGGGVAPWPEDRHASTAAPSGERCGPITRRSAACTCGTCLPPTRPGARPCGSRPLTSSSTIPRTASPPRPSRFCARWPEGPGWPNASTPCSPGDAST